MHTKHALSGAALVALCLGSAIAGPADYVYTPIVSDGEREIEFKSGSASKKGEPAASASKKGEPAASAVSIAYGYGAKAWWFTEFATQWKREDGHATCFDAIEWENRFQLTETGKYPVDLGFLLEFERPRDRHEGLEVKYGPLLQTEFDKVQINANLLFERHFRATEPSSLETSYQFQAKYRYRPEFEFGIQALGDLGTWNKKEGWGELSQRVGPAIFGKFKLEGRQAIKYDVALLIGTNNRSPDKTLRMLIEYEF